MGWINYYGRFRPWELIPFVMRINATKHHSAAPRPSGRGAALPDLPLHRGAFAC
ncbi:hypothetical protein [Streptomyces leeuwenhoekii]|uniref:hypothetical protein n=1 Tax=Streptomyces leeuwenhoekii TaxID=1437453 RepID=UPI001F1E16B3|nr:hypothetical protein [Streptomyces leeuwenhoekii]